MKVAKLILKTGELKVEFGCLKVKTGELKVWVAELNIKTANSHKNPGKSFNRFAGGLFLVCVLGCFEKIVEVFQENSSFI